MILKRFYDENLAQASYLVGCEKTKQAAIVDPSLDTSLYVEAAARLKLSIAHVAETHIHADFLSGAASLAAETGGELWLSGEGGARWGYDFQSADSARELRDGDEIRIGQVTLRALHTPGHTPEHLTFVVSDASRGEASVGALTGDFIFVGDVGRPDLLERAVGGRDVAVSPDDVDGDRGKGDRPGVHPVEPVPPDGRRDQEREAGDEQVEGADT